MKGERCPGSEDEPVPGTEITRFDRRNKNGKGTPAGICRACDAEYALRADGLVRKHNRLAEGAVRSEVA